MERTLSLYLDGYAAVAVCQGHRVPLRTASHLSLLPSEESIIHKLVEGLQEVDSDLGRQVSTAQTLQLDTGVRTPSSET